MHYTNPHLIYLTLHWELVRYCFWWPVFVYLCVTLFASKMMEKWLQLSPQNSKYVKSGRGNMPLNFGQTLSKIQNIWYKKKIATINAVWWMLIKCMGQVWLCLAWLVLCYVCVVCVTLCSWTSALTGCGFKQVKHLNCSWDYRSLYTCNIACFCRAGRYL